MISTPLQGSFAGIDCISRYREYLLLSQKALR
jgi:hypothetical protein